MAISKEVFMRVYVDGEGKHRVETPEGEEVPCIQQIKVDQDTREAQKGIATVTVTFLANLSDNHE